MRLAEPLLDEGVIQLMLQVLEDAIEHDRGKENFTILQVAMAGASSYLFARLTHPMFEYFTSLVYGMITIQARLMPEETEEEGLDSDSDSDEADDVGAGPDGEDAG